MEQCAQHIAEHIVTRAEMEAIRTECLQAVRALDLRTRRDTGRRLKLITVAYDAQQCQLMDIARTLEGLVRDGFCTRADIARHATG